jgi:arginyl-tRNA synthetase
MIRDTIVEMVTRSVAALREQGELPEVEIPPFEVERPQIAAHGDYATNAAMKLAAAVRASGGAKANPRALAEAIAGRIRETAAVVPAYDLVEGVEVAGPGFINVRLKPTWLLAQAEMVIRAGSAHGASEMGRGRKVNLEFVSANPTGPVTVGNGRGAFIGDALASVLRAAGYDVTTEYYFNNAGAQIVTLGCSMEYYLWGALGETARAEQVYAALPEAKAAKKPSSEQYRKGPRAKEQATAEEQEALEEAIEEAIEEAPAETQQPGRKSGYFGSYYETVAARIAQVEAEARALLALPDDARALAIGQAAAAIIMGDIRQTMAKMRVEFDVWFNEADLVTTGAREEGIAALQAAGNAEEREGALWAKTAAYGDTQDWVIRKSDGTPTYFASDVAYMRNKLERGHERLLYVLGADHHSYIGRLKALAQMLGHRPEDVDVILYQSVRLVVNGQPARMGKRLGNVVTLDELYEDIGTDVTRFFYLMRSNDTALDFDLGLARKQSDENPGLSVQYAHARASGVFRKAREQGSTEETYGAADARVLADDPPEQRDYELALMRQILRLEEVVERVALDLAPHHLTRYAMDLADAFHLYYDHCPILKQGVEVTRAVRDARLLLLRTAQAGLARTLTLLGMEAPERMERESETVAVS